jgi:short-subunit dehydrogenase
MANSAVQGELAVVTGASAGMGKEFARQLAAQGYDLLLVARRLDRLEQLCGEIRAAHPVKCEAMAADLTSDADLGKVEERLRADPKAGLLVNNAGFGTLGKFQNSSMESQDQMHRLHVIATMRLCHAALGPMIERDHGGIINVSSVAGFVSSAGSVSYCSTKAWINRFTEGIFMELKMAGSGVWFMALCPGYTRTEFHATLKMDTTKVADWMWLPAERVVRESLQGLSAGKLVVVPGMRYRAMLLAYSLLPAQARMALGTRAPKYRRPV